MAAVILQDIQSQMEPKGEIIDMQKNRKSRYQCSECNFATAFKVFLKKHTAKVHKAQDIFECKKCSYTHKDEENVENHEKIVHAEEKTQFCCGFCSNSFEVQSLLRIHVHERHSKKPCQSKKKKFACHECGKYYVFESGLFNHIKKVHEKENKKTKRRGCPTDLNKSGLTLPNPMRKRARLAITQASNSGVNHSNVEIQDIERCLNSDADTESLNTDERSRIANAGDDAQKDLFDSLLESSTKSKKKKEKPRSLEDLIDSNVKDVRSSESEGNSSAKKAAATSFDSLLHRGISDSSSEPPSSERDFLPHFADSDDENDFGKAPLIFYTAEEIVEEDGSRKYVTKSFT